MAEDAGRIETADATRLYQARERRWGRWVWRICLVLLMLYVIVWGIALWRSNGLVWPWFKSDDPPDVGPHQFLFLDNDVDSVGLAWMTVGNGQTPLMKEDVDDWFEFSPFSTTWSLGPPDPDLDSARSRHGDLWGAEWSVVEMKAGSETRWSQNPQVWLKSRQLYLPVWTAWIPILTLPMPAICALYRWDKKRERNRKGKCIVCGYDLRHSPDRCPECGRATQAVALKSVE